MIDLTLQRFTTKLDITRVPVMVIDNNQDILFTDNDITLIENEYDVKFVCVTSIKTKTSEDDFVWFGPVGIFYNPDPDVGRGHSHYLAVYQRDGHWWLADGKSATEDHFVGIAHNGTVYYSAYRHHFNSPTDNVFIDGGRNYTRVGGMCSTVPLQIIDGELRIIE